MTNEQLCLAIGVPIVANAVMLLRFSAMVNSRLGSFEASINKRFDDMRELWRTELRRVEEVLDGADRTRQRP